MILMTFLHDHYLDALKKGISTIVVLTILNVMPCMSM